MYSEGRQDMYECRTEKKLSACVKNDAAFCAVVKFCITNRLFRSE